MQPARNAVGLVLSALLATPLPAVANPVDSTNAAGSPPVAPAAPAVDPVASSVPEATPNPFGPVKAVASDKLESVRGGTEITMNDMRLRGTVAGNAAIDTVSGMNIISDGSFANAAGLTTAIQNSGSNVLIQNATIVNVQFRQ